VTLFNRLLLAIDLSPAADHLLSRVHKFCYDHMDRVHVVHVLRSDFILAEESDGGTGALAAEQKRLKDQASVSLSEILVRNGFNISANRIVIRAGEPATEIKRLAHDLEADLVIVGSHNRDSGWLNLPGATTNCVLQGIQSDVMAVRV